MKALPPNKKHRTLVRKLTMLILLPLLCEFLFVGILGALLIFADEDAKKIETSKRVQAVCATIAKLAYQTTASAVLYTARRLEVAKLAYEEGRAQFPNIIRDLDRICANDAASQRQAEIIAVLSNRLTDKLDSVIGSQSLIDLSRATEVLQDVAFIDQRIMEACSRIIAAQERVQSYRGSGIDWRTLIATVISLGLITSIVGSFLVVRYVYRDLLNRINVMVDNTQKVVKLEQLNQPDGGDDELSQLDRFIHEMDQQLKESARTRKRFTAMLTHDMKSPVTQFYFALDSLLLDSYNEPTRRRNTVSQLFPEIGRLRRLIDDMLTVSKLEEGRLQLKPSTFSVKTVIAEVCLALENEADANAQTVEHNCQEHMIVADQFQVKRVLVNLISNALRYSPSDSIIAVLAKQNESNMVFDIVDQGPGVPAESRDTVFLDYHQLDPDRGSEGVGLGLSICKMIVEAHHGVIEVLDRQDGLSGANFRFSIPMKPPIENDEMPRPNATK